MSSTSSTISDIERLLADALKVQSFDGNAFGDGAVLGCDFVGEVVELGSNVKRFSKRDIIAGLVWGGK